MPAYGKQVSAGAPAIAQLKTANHLLMDRDGLREAWNRDGYWFFKDVLDKAVIAEFKLYWLDHLKELGLVDADAKSAIYNGSAFTRISRDELYRLEKLNALDVHRFLTENKTINATIKQIIGDDPFWLPIAEYRATPPGADAAEKRFVWAHQDGFYNPGIPMKTCWIPLESVDEEIGGCAWAEGMHKGPALHDLSKPPLFPVPPDAVPPDRWRTSKFDAGDLVIFHHNLPHSGMSNISKDRFRLSMDIRLVEASGKVPSIGDVVALTSDFLTIKNERGGKNETYAITDDTFCRTADSKKLLKHDIPGAFSLGERVIVSSDEGRSLTVLRSAH
jgi:ectoine hydroxylase-related dioxygenase (phytanoyl-CoA dioxygenase family)